MKGVRVVLEMGGVVEHAYYGALVDSTLVSHLGRSLDIFPVCLGVSSAIKLKAVRQIGISELVGV